MASSSASTTQDSPPPAPVSPPSAKLDELRGALASKGLVVKDSILARLAKSKSFREAVTVPGTLAQATEPASETSPELSDPGADASAQDDELGFEKRLQALVAEKPQEKASQKPVDSSTDSDKCEKEIEASVADGEVKGVEDVNVSEEERKQRRAERFGTVVEYEKLKLRAARFGINNDDKEAEKKRARAARFGIVDEDAKKRARLERFGKESEEDPMEIEKRKARAARFA